MKIETDPRLTPGPAFFASVIEWMRRAAQAINPLVDSVTTIGGYFVSGVLAITRGGTGATTAAGARTSFGLANHNLVTVDTGGAATLGAGGNGVTVSGYYTGGGPIYKQSLVAGNPNWNACDIQLLHFPAVWAGFRMEVNGQAFDLRNDGIGYCPGGWTTTSDRRKKAEMVPMQDALSKVAGLTAYTFTRPDIVNEFAKQPRRYLGLVAQDALEVIPEAVSAQEDDERILSLDYGAISALNSHAINELHALVLRLQGRVEILEGSK